MRAGVLGGSFNPVHNGHIDFANFCIDALELDVVFLIPTYITPLKNNENFASAQHRFNMCLLASEKYDKIKVSDIEIKRQGKSYTSETLSQLKKNAPETKLFYILGADAFLSIESWHDPDTIFKNATLVTTARTDSDREKIIRQKSILKDKNADVIILDKKQDLISSTKVRNMLLGHENVSNLIDKKVLLYIKENNLYGM